MQSDDGWRRSRRQRQYNSVLVSAVTGLNQRTLNEWAAHIAPPSIRDAEGRKGRGRRWSYVDLIALRAAKRLRDAGVGLPVLQRIIEELRQNAGTDLRPLVHKTLITDGSSSWLVTDEQEMLEILKRPAASGDLKSMPDMESRVFIVLHLAAVVKEVDTGYWAFRDMKTAQKQAREAGTTDTN